MAKATHSTAGRKSAASKSRPAKKASGPRKAPTRMREPDRLAAPKPLTDALDEALAETFPASDPVQIGHTNHVGRPIPMPASFATKVVDTIKRFVGRI